MLEIIAVSQYIGGSAALKGVYLAALFYAWGTNSNDVMSLVNKVTGVVFEQRYGDVYLDDTSPQRRDKGRMLYDWYVLHPVLCRDPQ